MRTTLMTFLTLGLLSGCGGSESDHSNVGATGGSSGSSGSSGSAGGLENDAAANAAPSWPDAPDAPVRIPQGRTTRIALHPNDPDSDPVSIATQGPEEIEISFDEDTKELVLRPSLLSAEEQTVQIVLDDGQGGSTTVPLTLEIVQLTWTDQVTWQNSEDPESREHASVLVDDASQSVYVIFGSGYSPYGEALGDGYRFDTATRTFTELTLAGDVPAPGGSLRFAGQRGTGVGYLFGGYGENDSLSSSLHRVEVDGDTATFTEIPQSTPSPAARALHVFAFDPGTETFVLFGGAGTKLWGDTWTMKIEDGIAQWQLVDDGSSGTGPVERFGAFFGLDEERGRLVMFSGQTSMFSKFGQDTWVFDVRGEPPQWSEVTTEFSPPGRRNGTFVWDPVGERLFVFGGTSDGKTSQPGLFAFDGRPGQEGWTEVSRSDPPPLRSSGFGAFLADEKGPFGGAVWMGFGNSATGVYRDLARLGYHLP